MLFQLGQGHGDPAGDPDVRRRSGADGAVRAGKEQHSILQCLAVRGEAYQRLIGGGGEGAGYIGDRETCGIDVPCEEQGGAVRAESKARDAGTRDVGGEGEGVAARSDLGDKTGDWTEHRRLQRGNGWEGRARGGTGDVGVVETVGDDCRRRGGAVGSAEVGDVLEMGAVRGEPLQEAVAGVP